MVQGRGFKMFCNALNPRFQVPTKKTVAKYLTAIYDEEKEKLVGEMAGKTFSATTDLWTSNALQGYITVTGHYLSSDWALHSKVLATRVVHDRHTGTNIASEVNKIFSEFKLDKPLAIVTDNAANMGIAARELGIHHVHCYAHTLQLAIEKGLKITQISKTLGSARKLVSHFSHSVLATNSLVEKQTTLPKLKLVQDVATRWNSSFYMMDRLLKLRIPVYGVIFDDEITKPADRTILDIRDSFWAVMENICPVLEPLAEVTDLLGRDDLPTGSTVYVLIHNIVTEVLKVGQNDHEVVKQLKEKIKNGLIKRFKLNLSGIPTDEMLTNPLLIATVLDLRYKAKLGRDILPPPKKQVLYAKVQSLMEDITVDTETNNGEGAVPKKKPKLWDIIQGDFTSLSGGTNMSVELEFQSYIDQTVTISNPLEWWNLNQGKFPRLKHLAMSYLAIPATSIPSERTFSTAGLTVTKLRSSLEPDTVDHIIFLNRNIGKGVADSDCVGKCVQEKATESEGPSRKTELEDFLQNSVAKEVKQEELDSLI